MRQQPPHSHPAPHPRQVGAAGHNPQGWHEGHPGLQHSGQPSTDAYQERAHSQPRQRAQHDAALGHHENEPHAKGYGKGGKSHQLSSMQPHAGQFPQHAASAKGPHGLGAKGGPKGPHGPGAKGGHGPATHVDVQHSHVLSGQGQYSAMGDLISCDAPLQRDALQKRTRHWDAPIMGGLGEEQSVVSILLSRIQKILFLQCYFPSAKQVYEDPSLRLG